MTEKTPLESTPSEQPQEDATEVTTTSQDESSQSGADEIHYDEDAQAAIARRLRELGYLE